MHLLHPTDLAKLSFGPNWVQKTKASINEISRMLFLKLVSTIFYQILIFSPNDSPSKTVKSGF